MIAWSSCMSASLGGDQDRVEREGGVEIPSMPNTYVPMHPASPSIGQSFRLRLLCLHDTKQHLPYAYVQGSPDTVCMMSR